MFNPDESYEWQGMAPQEIRADFMELTLGALYDPDRLLDALACWLPSDKLGEFMDDLAMGRI